MDEKNTIEIDNNILNYLRNNTKLSPIDLLKIHKEEVIAKNNRDYYMKENPNDLIEIDYTASVQLEYILRLKAFEHSVEKLWLQHGDGLDLSQFAMNIIIQNSNEYSPKNK